MIFYLPRTPEETERERRESLERDANRAGLCLNSASEQMFRVSPDCLIDEQRRILKGMFYEAYEAKHKHFCIECGDAIRCDEPGCTETEGYDHCDDEPDRPRRVFSVVMV